MNFIYFGTPDFSAQCLQKIIEHGFIPRAVVCNPDRPTGRKKILTAPPVKTFLADHFPDIDILQPEKLDSDFQATLRSYKPDFFVVFAYNKIFRKEILGIPPIGTIGIHPSFLPEYRGPSPFQTAIFDGKTETGVTLYLLDEGIDSGPILARSEPIAIRDADMFQSLAITLADTAADLLVHTLPLFISREITAQPQDEARATFTKKFKTQDGFIDARDLHDAENGNKEKATVIFNTIRAFTPEPGCWTMRDERRVKLLHAEIIGDQLKLLKIQNEGEKPKNL